MTKYHKMFAEEYDGINSFMVGVSKLILKHGIRREVRNSVCWELPEPLFAKIKRPNSRWITLPERKWNPYLPYIESLWIAAGRNDLAMPGNYLKKLGDFSDDGEYLRGGYGPRVRHYNGEVFNYSSGKTKKHSAFEVDQFQYIIEAFQKDPFTRRAIIQIGDPIKDNFSTDGKLKTTKDYPCSRSLQFTRQAGSNKLDLTVYMRSNDLLWGATGVNIFNFTFIQEYIANILGFELGSYYHFVNNIHYYEVQSPRIKSIARVKNYNDSVFSYSSKINSLNNFDDKIQRLLQWEETLRQQKKVNHLIQFEDAFFADWAKVIYHYHTKFDLVFKNPILHGLLNKKIDLP